MKILIASELEEIVGGRETYLQAVVRLLREAGHELGFAFEHKTAQTDRSLIGNDPGMVWQLPGQYDQAALWNPDIVYLHGLADPALEALLAKQFRTIYFPHGYYGTCLSGTKRFAWPGVEACQRVMGLGCLIRYFPRRCGGLHPGTMLQQYRVQTQHKEVLPNYRSVIVASRHMWEEYRRHGVAPERLHLVPYFPPHAVPDARPPEDRPFSNRVLMVGRLTSLKGGRYLVDALPIASAKLGRPLELIVAGDGSEKAALEAQAHKKNVPAHFLGWIDAARCTEQMRSADVLAVPSVWPEPFGLVGIEAGCVGLPAVAFAAGGIPDWLRNGNSGELADTWNEYALAEALVRALRDAKHWSLLRRGAWAAAHDFSWQRHMEKLQAILLAAKDLPG